MPFSDTAAQKITQMLEKVRQKSSAKTSPESQKSPAMEQTPNVGCSQDTTFQDLGFGLEFFEDYEMSSFGFDFPSNPEQSWELDEGLFSFPPE